MSEERQPAKEAGSARPTGKRQLTGVSTTSTAQVEAKKASRAVVKDDEKIGGGVTAFLPEVGQEMKKVIWPTAKQMVTYTTIVFVFLILTTLLVSGIDWAAGLGVEKVLTH